MTHTPSIDELIATIEREGREAVAKTEAQRDRFVADMDARIADAKRRAAVRA